MPTDPSLADSLIERTNRFVMDRFIEATQRNGFCLLIDLHLTEADRSKIAIEAAKAFLAQSMVKAATTALSAPERRWFSTGGSAPGAEARPGIAREGAEMFPGCQCPELPSRCDCYLKWVAGAPFKG